MAQNDSLSIVEFLTDIRRVITSPRRRFPVIRDRDELWGSILLLVVPAYFGFGFLGGVYFERDPFPGYSWLVPAIAAVLLTFLKLFGIHVLARFFKPRAQHVGARRSFRQLLVVFGYTGVPAILAMSSSLLFFVSVPTQVGYFYRNFHVVAISLLIAFAVALFIWNLILMVLALRTVYDIADAKIVLAVLLGPLAITAPPAVLGSRAVASGKVDMSYVRPVLAERIVSFFAAENGSDGQRQRRISLHIDRIAYSVRAPRRFDLVAFELAEQQNGGGLSLAAGGLFSMHATGLGAGRIVGLPGDEVEVAEGKLRINGQPWREPYIPEEFSSTASLLPMSLGPADYLVLPEDRRRLESAQSETVVHRKRIFGRLIVRKWPFGWWMFRSTAFLTAQPAPGQNAQKLCIPGGWTPTSLRYTDNWPRWWISCSAIP